MSIASRFPVEKIVLAGSAVVLSAAVAWWWLQQPLVQQVARESVAANLSGRAYEAQAVAAKANKVTPWPKPVAQSHGPGWVYEVFTPPVIYYHASARSFTVTPPTFLADSASPFGLELLDVKLELFRLQLAGYVGAPGDYIAAFVSPKTPETYLARRGKRFDELGLTLQEFAVKKVPVPTSDSMPVYDVAAIAVVRDEKSGELLTLDSRQRKFTDTPLAVLRMGAAGKAREVREGEVFQDENATYRVDRIQMDPPEVVVAKQVNGLPYPETRVLKPAADKAQAARAPKRFNERPSTGVANTDASR